MAPLQPLANFKHKFFWGTLALGNSNLVSSSSSNVVSINLVLVKMPPIEVSEQEKHLKNKECEIH
jgi:hypothetical protein